MTATLEPRSFSPASAPRAPYRDGGTTPRFEPAGARTDTDWRAVAERWPRSATVGVALLPWVVRLAAARPPEERDEHLAFVADVAFGGRRDARRTARPLAGRCYRAVTELASGLIREGVRGDAWEPWECRWMTCACAHILGRLRAAASDGGAGPRPACDAAPAGRLDADPAVGGDAAEIAARAECDLAAGLLDAHTLVCASDGLARTDRTG